jgi:hypothetical protein
VSKRQGVMRQGSEVKSHDRAFGHYEITSLEIDEPIQLKYTVC